MIFNIDADVYNADWPKRTWDLLDIDSVEKLRAYLESRKISVESFKKLPIYIWNVEKLPWLKEL